IELAVSRQADRVRETLEPNQRDDRQVAMGVDASRFADGAGVIPLVAACRLCERLGRRCMVAFEEGGFALIGSQVGVRRMVPAVEFKEGYQFVCRCLLDADASEKLKGLTIGAGDAVLLNGLSLANEAVYKAISRRVSLRRCF